MHVNYSRFTIFLQAVECQLHGLSPSDVRWTDAALDRLDELTADTLNTLVQIEVRITFVP